MISFKSLIVNLLLLLLSINSVSAANVEILAAEFQYKSNEQWSVNVTLKHADSGWEHYADNWQLIDGEGKILGDRILYHPHVNEQPFTRSLSHLIIPQQTKIVYIIAHDKIHGWASTRLKVDLTEVKNNYLKVNKK